MTRLRPYQASDWDSFLALDLEAILQSMPGSTAAERDAVRARWPALLRDKLASVLQDRPEEEDEILVLESDAGEYVGHLWLSRHDNVFSGQRSLHVTSVAVDARFRRQGHGQRLMQHAIELSQRRSLPLQLSVGAENDPARRLYEKLGFAPVRLTMSRSVHASPSSSSAGQPTV